MRAVTIRAFGDPDGMDVVDRPAPAPAPGEVVIRTEAIAVGVVGGHPPADFGTAILGAFQRSVSFGTLSLATIPWAELARVRTEQFAAAVRGQVHPVVHDVMPLDAAADAHRRMDAGEVFGRIVLTP
jgi:NADPH:quinone reductase